MAPLAEDLEVGAAHAVPDPRRRAPDAPDPAPMRRREQAIRQAVAGAIAIRPGPRVEFEQDETVLPKRAARALDEVRDLDAGIDEPEHVRCEDEVRDPGRLVPLAAERVAPNLLEPLLRGARFELGQLGLVVVHAAQ